MNIYSDQCPHCGTLISIREATRYPGCMSNIYYGPGESNDPGEPDFYIGFHYNYYYPTKESRDAQIERNFDKKAYWDSEKGQKTMQEI